MYTGFVRLLLYMLSWKTIPKPQLTKFVVLVLREANNSPVVTAVFPLGFVPRKQSAVLNNVPLKPVNLAKIVLMPSYLVSCFCPAVGLISCSLNNQARQQCLIKG